MGIYSTLWEADDWATRGGLEKIDWSKAPFYAYYKDFDVEGCWMPGPKSCITNPNNWWEGQAYRQLDAVQQKKYQWVRTNHMIYDYCTDKSRYPITPPECIAWFRSLSSCPNYHNYQSMSLNLRTCFIYLCNIYGCTPISFFNLSKSSLYLYLFRLLCFLLYIYNNNFF